MIPFRDDVPSRTYPLVTLVLILVNVAVFIYQWTLPEGRLAAFIQGNGVVPARLLLLERAPGLVMADTGRTVLTSMFLHGGWLHLIGNMWYLWIFGDNVEDRMGHLRFLAFYLLCGALAGWTHILFNLESQLPSIGASGAVAGVLGAYLMSYPFARVLTIVPLLFLFPIIELPAMIVLGGWFLVQLLSGVASIGASAQAAGGVAWWAHIGGFVSGVVLIGAFARPETPRYQWKSRRYRLRPRSYDWKV